MNRKYHFTLFVVFSRLWAPTIVAGAVELINSLAKATCDFCFLHPDFWLGYICQHVACAVTISRLGFCLVYTGNPVFAQVIIHCKSEANLRKSEWKVRLLRYVGSAGICWHARLLWMLFFRGRQFALPSVGFLFIYASRWHTGGNKTMFAHITLLSPFLSTFPSPYVRFIVHPSFFHPSCVLFVPVTFHVTLYFVPLSQTLLSRPLLFLCVHGPPLGLPQCLSSQPSP